MSIINYYNSPTVINWNLDEFGKPVSLLMQNEIKQVVDGKIPLEGLPDEQYRIQITGYVEINIKDKIDSPNKFKCDYTHGVLYFDQSRNGQSINITKYYSRGSFYIPAQRVYTKINNFGEVVETLDGVVDDIANLSDQITVIADIAQNANVVKNDLQQGIADGTVLKVDLDTSISTAINKKTQLDNSVSVANTSKDELNTSISDSNTSKSNLDNSIVESATSKSNLDISISNANNINDILSDSTTGTIKQATDVNSMLNTSISNSSVSKTDLDASISNSVTAKSNLDNSISTANTAKIELDGSVSIGNDLKGELDMIITGTDFEQITIDLNSLKQDQHSHINKATLDGLSDVDGKLKYNGQDVGVGDMTKAIYDTNNDGKVDIAEDAEKLGGQLPIYYAKQDDMNNKVDNSRVLTDVPTDAKFTDTVTEVKNNLTETVDGSALDATQGKVLDDKIGVLNGDLLTLEYSELSSIATNVDSEGIYLNTEWKRTDNTTYAKSTLLGTSPSYNQVKIDYYNDLGTTIIKTIKWDLTYDGNDFAYQRTVV